MNQDEIINRVQEIVKQKLSGEGSGHDWWHVYRVWKLARTICQKEKADMFVVELGALLHDIADYKFYDGDETVGPKIAKEILETVHVDTDVIYQVIHIIENISYKGAKVKNKMHSLEGKIVQDADRLDAIGAIGIARTFAYGGHKGREMYNPDIKPELHDNPENYKKNTSPTINHFYEKLLLLKDLMNTETGKHMALERHRYMEQYLDQFYKEWDGKK